MACRRPSQPPPQRGEGTNREGNREPGCGVLRSHAEESPEGGQLKDPQEVGVALDVFAGVEDEAVAFEQIADVAKADEGVVGQEPGDAGEPSQQHQPGQGQQMDHTPAARCHE